MKLYFVSCAYSIKQASRFDVLKGFLIIVQIYSTGSCSISTVPTLEWANHVAMEPLGAFDEAPI